MLSPTAPTQHAARLRGFVVLAAILLLVTWLFPPWNGVVQQQGLSSKSEPLGFRLLLSPPDAPYKPIRGASGVELDLGRLVLINLSILMGTAVAYLVRMDRMPGALRRFLFASVAGDRIRLLAAALLVCSLLGLLGWALVEGRR
jgi:hypothetical protein